jgi:CheY-like chemotaxis protein
MSRNRRILLVDDSLADLQIALRALAECRRDLDVVTARDGVEALDYLHRRGTFAGLADGHPALVLLDLKMPRLDGLETLAELKSRSELRAIPVVFFTSSRLESDISRGYALGANGYVVKPMDFTETVRVLSDTVGFWISTNELPVGQRFALSQPAPARS